MEILLLALTIGLPLIKIVMFPARAIGRGGNWTLVGAAMIVALMMVVWFAMQSVTDVNDDDAAAQAKSSSAASAAPPQFPDLDNLARTL